MIVNKSSEFLNIIAEWKNKNIDNQLFTQEGKLLLFPLHFDWYRIF